MTQSTVFEAESNQGRGAEAPNGLEVNSTGTCSPEPAGGSAPMSERQIETGPGRGFSVPQTCLSSLAFLPAGRVVLKEFHVSEPQFPHLWSGM